MTTLRARVTKLEYQVDELRLEAIRARALAIGSIRTEVATLTNDVDGLRAEVGTLSTDVGGLRTELRDSFARMTALLTKEAQTS